MVIRQQAKPWRKGAGLYDGHGQALRCNRLHGCKTVADESQPPGASRCVERLGRPFPEQAALRIERHRKRVLRFDRMRGAGRPHRLFAAQEFDLVITDVIMPEMTGPELIRHLKSTYDREFGVLFVTGYVGEGESDDLRGYELLRKPFTVGALASAVSSALGRVASAPPRNQARA